MRTIVVSDLHLGSGTGADVLRHAPARDALVAALAGAGRLVLLGDVIELRHGPVPAALEAAEPAMRAIGAALGPDAEVVLLAGNHDHALVAPWLERRALAREGPLGLEHMAEPDESEPVATLARWLRPARVRLAYPGIWLRDDVYAMHGHYLDRHVTVPTFERIAAGAMVRVVGDVPDDGAAPDDYEAALGPLYAWLHVVARQRAGFGADRQRGTQAAWRTLTDSGPRPLKARAVAAAFPLAVGLLNRVGIGPVDKDLSPAELRRAGLRAMAETVDRLAIAADWVLFGHTHRAGPLPQDGGREDEWRTGGARLVNTGCWVHEEVFLGDAGPDSPYWPGTVVEVGRDGPPRLRNALVDWRP